MDFESYGSDPPIPPEFDYCAPLRPQIHALHVETEEDRVSCSYPKHLTRAVRTNLDSSLRS
jgi:hypothetical protein